MATLEDKQAKVENLSHARIMSQKGGKWAQVLTVLFRTSMLGNFLLMYLRLDSMDFSSKKGGLDFGSEQVCTDKNKIKPPCYISTQIHTSN